MTELLTAAQMRAIERAAIDSGEVTGLELMERAGRGVVEAVFEEWPELAKTSHRAVVLCGPGNNGGDGFVVARLLKEWGWEVEVFLYGDPGKLPPDARVNYERWEELGNYRSAAEIVDESQLEKIDADIFVDALFGTGLTRPIEVPSRLLGPFFDFGDLWMFDNGPKTVSVDMPSGMCSDSGRALGAIMNAALTVTFHSAKRGHFLAPKHRIGSAGASNCGLLKAVDIGLPTQHRLKLIQKIRSLLPEDQKETVWTVAGSRLPLGKIFSSAHKYTHGHALILSGGPGKGGAARLAARGALRIGAGLVTVGCPPAALQENAAQLNAIMLKPLGSDEDLSLLLDSDSRLNALCLGPGLGTGARERQMVAAALAARRKTVLDADALTLIAGDTALFGALHDGCILTPHHGEFARLFLDIAEKLNAPATAGPAYSKVDATREAAKRAGCTVLFKGPDTVIASPDGRCAINSAHYERAAPWLATAGSGDVLAGFIAGLLARGFETQNAAETAAWLHVECALKFGPGLIAEDLPEMLPQVFRDLGV